MYINIIFMRHGEATDNVKGLISDKEIYWSILTDSGIKTVEESIKELPDVIDKIYVSPLPRTIETAHLVYKKYKESKIVIENRTRELNYGKYSGQKNNEDLDNTRIKQVEGDHFIRLGSTGENRFEIESRLSEFLKDVYNENSSKDTILIISHGSVISYMKRILNIKTSHLKTGKVEEFNNVDFTPLFKHLEKPKDIENRKEN